MSPEMLEMLLADPRFRPPGGFSRMAEEWTEANMTGDWRTVYALKSKEGELKKWKREAEGERAEAMKLTAELAARDAAAAPKEPAIQAERCPEI